MGKNQLCRVVAIALLVVIALPGRSIAQNAAYGMVTHYVDPTMGNKAQELGIGFVRVDFNWDQMQPTSDPCCNWGSTDATVIEARSRGLLVFATLAYTPGWANGFRSRSTPPSNLQDWYNFVYAVVQHYQGPNMDVWHFGMWNEPNDTNFFAGTIYDYENLASMGRQAVKDANAGANVLGPEVGWGAVCGTWFGQVMDSLRFVFDIVTVHYYYDACDDPGTFMDWASAHLYAPRPMWMTEVGWNSCSGGEGSQSSAYNTVLDDYQQRRTWWTGIFGYDLYENTGCSEAITNSNYSNRQAFGTYQWYIQNYP